MSGSDSELTSRDLPTADRSTTVADPPLPPTRTIDLREAEEIGAIGRVLLPGAEHLPMDRLLSSLDDLDREASYLLVCEHGTRSTMSRDAMVAAGFHNVTHMGGGYAALRAMIQ